MRCPLCTVVVTEKKYLGHLRAFHWGDKNLNLKCIACDSMFSAASTFQKHWYAKHYVSKIKSTLSLKPLSEDVTVPPTVNVYPDRVLLESNDIVMVNEKCADKTKIDSGNQNVEECSNVPNLPSNSESIKDTSFPVENFELDSDSILSFDLASTSASKKTHIKMPSSSVATKTTVCTNPKTVTGSDSLCGEMDIGSESEEESERDVTDDEHFVSNSTSTSVQIQSDSVQVSLPVPVSCPVNVNMDGARFVLSLREKAGVKSDKITEIIKDAESLIRKSVEKFSADVQEKLKSKNVSLHDVMNVKESVSTCSKVFDNLNSVHRQNKVFTDVLGVISPDKIPVGRDLKRVRQRASTGRKTAMLFEEFMYVPLPKIVEKLVNHPDYNYLVENQSGAKNSHYLDSYMKGELSKKNPILKNHPDALRLVLYYDDLEACSPLKSRAGKQKLGAFYMFLDNIHPKYRTNLSLISLLALVNANLIKDSKYGMDCILEHIVKDLKKFENGFTLTNGVKVYGTLIASIGDNPALSALGGFKEGFTAHRMCRFCNITYEEIQSIFSEEGVTLRDQETHTKHVNLVQTSRGKNASLSTEYGVNRDSKLNELSSFHVTYGLPPDIMHDLLEGVLPLTLKRLLNYLIYEKKEKKFTLDWLNNAIKDFDFDYYEIKDKPSEIKKEHLTGDGSIHQSASQMSLLAFILPLILGPHVSKDDPYWSNFLDLLEICKIVFTVDLSLWMVSYLKDLIETYLKETYELYGHLIPKMHHLLHYPTMILRFGTLTRFMCMRCEAKHKYFKQIVTVLGNYKNIPFTLAEKHQMHQGYLWSKSLLYQAEHGSLSTIYVKTSTLKFLLPANLEYVVETKWLDLEGIKFIPDRCYIAVGCVDCLPVFAKVVKIILKPDLLLLCSDVITIKRDIHFGSYVIKNVERFHAYTPKDMLIPTLFHHHKVEGRLHIFSKVCIGDAL